MFSTFFDLFVTTVKTNLNDEQNGMKEMEKIAASVKDAGKIGIFPCNRYSRKILNFFEENHPDLMGRIEAVYDKSTNVNFRNDFIVRRIDQVNADDIDVLIVAASKFPEDLLLDLKEAGFPVEKCVVTSLIKEQLSHYTSDEIILKVKKVVDRVSDKKSRITYLLTWISMLLLDKDILSVYFMHSDYIYKPDGVVDYHSMTLTNMQDMTIQYSLALETYKMSKVVPEPGDVVVDVGAYRGDTAAFFRKYIGGSGKVYAFEPDEQNYAYLTENIDRNRMDNVIPVKKALYDKNTTCNLISTPQSGSFLYVMKEHLDTEDFSKVNAVTLDDFCTENGIEKLDFIKSDIEGCELEMLRGGRETIDRFKPKMALAIYHSISDMLDVPLYISELSDGYELFIRHLNFTGSPWEILLFAKQKGANDATQAATDAA